MNLPPDVRIESKLGLSSDEVADVNRLVDLCNRLESLDLPLQASSENAGPRAEPTHFLAREGERLVGYLGLQGGDEIEVCLGVDPERRRRGIGRGLLTTAGEAVRRQGKTRWLLVCDEASPSGQAFIQAVGAAYRSSEYRLLLDPRAVPEKRDWPTPVQLRRGSADDVALVAHLIAASFGDVDEEVKGWVTQAMGLENHRFFIAGIDGQPIGCIRTNYYGTTIYITAFGVLPEQRGRGYGRQILLQIIDKLLQEKWPKILIEVATDNRHALGLYLTCGFQEMTTYGYYAQTISAGVTSFCRC